MIRVIDTSLLELSHNSPTLSDLKLKVLKAFVGCKDREHLAGAERYADLAVKRLDEYQGGILLDWINTNDTIKRRRSNLSSLARPERVVNVV